MEFRIEWTSSKLDLDAIAEAIRGADPAALVDFDPVGPALRVAAVLDEEDLMRAFARTGSPVARSQVRRLPSVCCGGCSG